MALVSQFIDVVLDRGLDERTDDRVSQGFSRLLNAQWFEEGAVGKRNGYRIIGTSSLGAPGSGSIATLSKEDLRDPITGFGVRNDRDVEELVAFGSSSIWSYDNAIGAFVNKGARRRASVRGINHPASTESRIAASSAIIGDIRVTAWAGVTTQTGSSDYRQAFSVMDHRTNHIIIADENLSPITRSFGSQPRVVAIDGGGLGKRFHVLFVSATQGGGAGGSSTLSLYDRMIDVNTPWSSSVARVGNVLGSLSSSILTRGAIDNTFDAVFWNSERFGPCVLTAHTSGTSIWLNGTSVTGSHLFHSGTSIIDSDDILGLACSNQFAQLVSIEQTPERDIYAHVLDASAMETDVQQLKSHWMDPTVFFQARHAVGRAVTGSNTFEWFITFQGALSGSATTHMDDEDVAFKNRTFSWVNKHPVVAGVAGTGSLPIFHVEAQGYPFTASIRDHTGELRTQDFIHVGHFADVQSLGMVMDLSGTVWGVYDRDLAYPIGQGVRPRVASPVSGVFDLPVIKRGRGIVSGALIRSDFDFVRFDLDPDEPGQTQIGDLLVHGGGQVRVYDGVQDVELGFNTFPLLPSSQSIVRESDGVDDEIDPFTFLAGTTRSAGTYRYFVTYHWWDATGREHRSNPGPGATLVRTANEGAFGSVTVRIPRLTATDKSNVVTRLWRTEVNAQVPYLVSSDAVPNQSSTTRYLIITDDVTDAALISHEVLYTLGELPNDPPPQSTVMATWDNRLWLLDDTDGLTLWFSKAFTAELAPEMSVYQTIAIDPAGGRVTALMPMDDKLVVFKADRILIVHGSGPDTFGLNGSYAVQLVTADTGCVEPRSVGTISQGLVFKGKRGIYLLDRGLNPAFIGAAVDDDVTNRRIVSTTVDPSQHLVRFSCADGTQLAFDTALSRWTTHAFTGSLMNSSSLELAAASIWDGRHVVSIRGVSGSTPTGPSKVMVTTSGSWVDATGSLGTGSAFPLSIGTPWFHLAGIDGFQRIRGVTFTGDFKSDHRVRLGVFYDYGNLSGTTDYEVTGTVSDFVNGASGSVYEFEHRLHHQKCEAVRFVLTDEVPSGSRESFRLGSLRLEVRVKPNASHIPPGRRLA